MNYIRAYHSTHSIRWWIALAVAATAIVFFIGLGTAQASDEWPVVASHGESVSAQQQSSDESGLPWLFAVFFITWAAFFGYVFIMSQRQREMRREIEALKRALADRDGEMTRTGQEHRQ